MKRPKPQPPANLPEETVSFGGPIKWFSIALIIRTDAVPIERSSRLLRCEPTNFQQKGVPLFRPDGTIKRIPKFSSWRLKLSPEEVDEWDICEAAKLLLARVSDEISIWHEISGGGDARLSFGLSMNETNLGFSLDLELIQYLADHAIRADFDVYTEDFDLPFTPPPTQSGPTSH
jgi:Domain of unknown function (DUF4279)